MTKPVAAVAALMLVEECRLRLDDPVDPLLPELAARRVLRQLDGPLDDTVPATRPITLRDLLTMRLGLGFLPVAPGSCPLQAACAELRILQGPPQPQRQPPPDLWLAGVGRLPLAAQPGERWLYDLGSDILGVLIARAADQPLDLFLEQRIFEPLGMVDTGFSVPATKRGHLATSYEVATTQGGLAVYDPADDQSQWATAPAFPSASGGLVSTADDYLNFSRMLLRGGRHGRTRLLSRSAVELMISNQLTPEQQAGAGMILDAGKGWGLGLAVTLRRDGLAMTPGQFGWDGGLGTSWRADPRLDLTGILLTQLAWTSPSQPAVCQDFWTATYQALAD
jgi:CubicO group peptidase (beta-lactamase class C family)